MRSSANQPLPSAASSCCSDMREINEMKVANIMSYLDDVAPPASLVGGEVRQSMTTFCLYDEQQPSLCTPPSHLNPMRANVPTAGSVRNGGCGASSIVSGITTLTTENQVYGGIKSKVEALRSTCETLQKENSSLRAKLTEDRSKYEKSLSTTRETAKAELEEALQQIRYLNKQHAEAMSKILTERNAATHALEEMTHKYRRETSNKEQEREALEAAHASAISQLKGKWLIQEKAAREKWKEKELKEMKQTTLKVLQPDIELLMKRHKAEKARLEEEFQDELKRRDKVLLDKEAAFEELKMRVQSTAENRVVQERQLADDRAREEVQRMRRAVEEMQAQSEKKRESQQSIFDEREQTLKYEIKKLEEELFEMRRKSMEGTAQFRDAVSSEVAKVSASHDDQLTHLKQKLVKDHDLAKERLVDENRCYLSAREEEIRSKCKVELDRAVAQIHERLEEAYISKVKEMKESDRMVRDKISRQERVIEQLQTDLELSQNQSKTAVETLRQKEEVIVCLQRDLKASREALEASRDVLEKEFDQRLRFLDGQWQQRLRQLEMDKVDAINELQHAQRKRELEWDATKSTLESDLRSLEQRHNAELSNISDKVLVTVSTKEGIIRQLNERVLTLENTLREKDAALEQHRSLLDG